MSELPDFVDPKYWFTLKSNPETKCYFVYNPHTFKGRVGAWGILHKGERVSFCVSKSEIAECSPEAVHWLNGFLVGNEPSPPLDANGDPFPQDSPELVHWHEAVELFHETGVWAVTPRQCEICGETLLPSQVEGLRCKEHLEDGKKISAV